MFFKWLSLSNDNTQYYFRDQAKHPVRDQKGEAICLVISQDNISQEEQINQFHTKKNVAQMRMI